MSTQSPEVGPVPGGHETDVLRGPHLNSRVVDAHELSQPLELFGRQRCRLGQLSGQPPLHGVSGWTASLLCAGTWPTFRRPAPDGVAKQVAVVAHALLAEPRVEIQGTSGDVVLGLAESPWASWVRRRGLDQSSATLARAAYRCHGARYSLAGRTRQQGRGSRLRGWVPHMTRLPAATTGRRMQRSPDRTRSSWFTRGSRKHR
jgi:hypothetical protein